MTDLINHPPHYADGWSNGAEVIDITENLNFNRGNAVKYIARAGKKNDEIEDLQKAAWYIQREIKRLEEGKNVDTTQPAPTASCRYKIGDRVEDWRLLPEGTVFEDNEYDEYIRTKPFQSEHSIYSNPGVRWTLNSDEAFAIVENTLEYAPYTVVSVAD